MSNIMRNEHPRPDFFRPSWVCLNGEWEFAEDPADCGFERGLSAADADDALFDFRINVPFCRESELSGLGHKEFCDAVWYRRKLMLSEGWLEDGKRLLLHIGACDWQTTIWVNGKFAGEHIGGYNQITADITRFVSEGENVITVRARDLVRTGNQAAGKQSQRFGSYGCMYTRTTGIWQTVWLENVPEAYVKNFRLYPDIAGQSVTVVANVKNAEGALLSAAADYEGKRVGMASGRVSGGVAAVKLPLSELHLWEIGHGRLYTLKLNLTGACETDDAVESYFGMRSVYAKDGFVYLNGKRIFQRLVLDQGFYPDGIYTAPSEQALIDDIERSVACGFDGARLHQKVFEPRFLYHCDRLGYIVWGEHGNWGMDIKRREAWAPFVPEWTEIIERDFNHPAIIGWCPLNETVRDQDPIFLRLLSSVTRSLDPTRMYIDVSGYQHVEGATDIYDTHDYDQNPESFGARYFKQTADGTSADRYNVLFKDKSTFVSEYGGIRWAPEGAGWGYGDAPKTADEFLNRFKGLADVLLDNPGVGGLCYTQLTDVEQEVNGLYTYARQAKFPPEFFKKVLQRKAACED
ncbi:MAG: beta-galactosidase [Clostridia bacterium]|nr:beta-galactosidase [Clostridia bacterium]